MPAITPITADSRWSWPRQTRRAALVDLVLPRACAGCREPGWSVCPACVDRFGPPRRHTPDPCPADWPPTFVGAEYADPVRTVLLAYKERGRGELAGPLADALARAVAAAVGRVEPVALVPVPSRRSAVRERGGDHLLRLTRLAARRLCAAGRDARVAAVLQVSGRPRDSAGLSAPARAANVRGSFRLARGRSRPLSTARVAVVVDDVVTTGATLTEVVRTLRAAVGGRVVVRAAAIAATPRVGVGPTPVRADTVTDSDRR